MGIIWWNHIGEHEPITRSTYNSPRYLPKWNEAEIKWRLPVSALGYRKLERTLLPKFQCKRSWITANSPVCLKPSECWRFRVSNWLKTCRDRDEMWAWAYWARSSISVGRVQWRLDIQCKRGGSSWVPQIKVSPNLCRLVVFLHRPHSVLIEYLGESWGCLLGIQTWEQEPAANLAGVLNSPWILFLFPLWKKSLIYRKNGNKHLSLDTGDKSKSLEARSLK